MQAVSNYQPRGINPGVTTGGQGDGSSSSERTEEVMAKDVYEKAQGVKSCVSHQSALTKDPRPHLWTDGSGGNWWCTGWIVEVTREHRG